MLRDAQHFKTRIGSLDGAGDAGDYIVNFVKNKSVPRASVQNPAAAEPATNGNNEGGVDSKVNASVVEELRQAQTSK